MTWFDYAVLTIMGISVLLSVLRGGMAEIISLTAWVLAFYLAQQFAPDLAARLPAEVPTQEIRLIAGFLGIFLGVWFLSAIVRITLSQFIKATALAPLDRLLGALFGFARGCLIVIALVIVGGMTNLPNSADWRNAMFSPPFEAAAARLKPLLPAALAQHMRYE